MKKLFSSIFKVFKFTGKLIVGVYQFLLTSLIIIVFGFMIISLVGQKELVVEPNSILKIDIVGNLVEQKTTPTSFNHLFSPFARQLPQETLIFDVIKALETASLDPNIILLQLDLSKMTNASLDNLQLLGSKVKDFKASGKEVVVAQDNYMQMHYYLAAYADTVIMNPGGAVLLNGFGSYKLYFKDFLDKLKISYNVFQVGDYKSALEPFTRTTMSSEDREQSSRWLTGLWDFYTTDINRLRNLAPDALLKYTNYTPALLLENDGNISEVALNIGLVDKLMHHHELSKFLKEKAQVAKDEKLKVINLDNYLNSINNTAGYESENKIAVIIAEGNIVSDDMSPGVISADLIVKKINAAAQNNKIKALVLRINSGGGSAFASEVIRQELMKFKESGKPLVVSMGRLAASGAYWISANADEIWAAPSTITGSIGIFGAIPTFEKGLSELGIYSDGTGTTPVASGLNLTRPLPDNLKKIIQFTVEHGYEQFLTIVSEGRNLDMEKVRKIAQGRVYIGRDAMELGLVDTLGNLEGAVDAAARLAEVELYEPLYIQASPSIRTKILELLSAGFEVFFEEEMFYQSPLIKHFLTTIENIEDFTNINDPNHIYVYGGSFDYQ